MNRSSLMKWLRNATYASYGVTMILIIHQLPAVGAPASIFRFTAWQIVLALCIVSERRA